MTTTLEVAEQLAEEVYGLHCDIGRLEVENRKLRELLKFVADNYVCGTYLLDRMRELGIEVDK